MCVRDRLVEAGHEPVIFHANGVGGPAMEHLIEAGALGGVIDYTLSELANSLLDGIHATGPDRLRVAGRAGLPQVVVPGCVDFFNQGPRDSLPERYRDAQELLPQPGRHARAARAPTRSASSGGWSPSGSTRRAGRSTWSPPRAASRSPTPRAATSGIRRPTSAFLDSLRTSLRPDIPYETVDAHVDDAEFADVVAERYLTLIQEPAHAG